MNGSSLSPSLRRPTGSEHRRTGTFVTSETGGRNGTHPEPVEDDVSKDRADESRDGRVPERRLEDALDGIQGPDRLLTRTRDNRPKSAVGASEPFTATRCRTRRTDTPNVAGALADGDADRQLGSRVGRAVGFLSWREACADNATAFYGRW